MATTRPLSRLLLLSHVGLVLLLALLLLATGAGVIRASIGDTARAEVAQAALDGLRRLDDQRRQVAVVAGLVTERPTLMRYLERRQPEPAATFLETFRETAQLDYLGVVGTAGPFAQTGEAPPDPGHAGLQFDPDGRRTWLVDTTTAGPPADHRVVAARALPREVATAAADDDVHVRLLAPDAAAPPRRDTGEVDQDLLDTYRHVQATARGETVAGDASGVVRVEPVRGADGAVEALLVATLPREAMVRETLQWLATFALGCVAVAGLAAVVAAWLSGRIARPFSEVADAAERLGLGDLRTPVAQPATDLSEPAALARSLETMRRQVSALTESERHQRHELDIVLDSVGDGIVAVDGEDIVRYANRQFLELTGRGEAEVIGVPFATVLPAAPGTASTAAAPPALEEARRSGRAHVAGDHLLGGRVRKLVIRSSAPMRGRQVAIVREETAAEASRAIRDAILANLSHEFQTPLAAQMASIELLQDHLHTHGGDATATRLVEAQYRGTLRLSQLVDNLLDSVRIENGEMRLRREPVHLVGLVEDAVALMRPLLEQRGQRVALDLAVHGDRRLLGDAQRLSQVAINLLANANKFAPDDTTIWLDLVWGDRTVSLWVEDEGPGLPPMPARADLFAPFRRAPDQEPSQRGTGLGLAIVRALVERHGGEIVIAEPRRRQGARFGVVLPVEDVACAS